MLGDSRSLDEVVRELSEMGYLTSFCTEGYRCVRTGDYFMRIAKTGKVREFCIPNAALTFKEYLMDHASPETRAAGEMLLERRIESVPEAIRPKIREWLVRIENGERDLRV